MKILNLIAALSLSAAPCAAMTQDIYTHIRDTHRAEVAQQINEKLRKK